MSAGFTRVQQCPKCRKHRTRVDATKEFSPWAGKDAAIPAEFQGDTVEIVCCAGCTKEHTPLQPGVKDAHGTGPTLVVRARIKHPPSDQEK